MGVLLVQHTFILPQTIVSWYYERYNLLVKYILARYKIIREDIFEYIAIIICIPTEDLYPALDVIDAISKH